jgi:hypothetical protein
MVSSSLVGIVAGRCAIQSGASKMPLLLREIGQLRQLKYHPNCEMAHRQEPFSLVVLDGRPSMGLRAVRFRP